MVNYICDKCGKTFSQKSHYDKHINKKYSCIQNKFENNNENNIFYIERKIMECITSKDAIKDEIHKIHNFMRNNGAGYGMSALKVFNIIYSLYRIEKIEYLEKLEINVKFSELVEFAKQNKGSIIKQKIDEVVDDLFNNPKLRNFLFHEVSKHIHENTWVELINMMSNISSLETNGEQLCGKIYEYFIGRDPSAISELGAYFTNRYITTFIYDDLLKDFIKLDDNGMIPSMIDMYGGSGGFTVGYVDYIINVLKLNVDWKKNINNVNHYDMNEDVIKYAALELFCLTKQLPDICENTTECKNIGYKNSFTFDFDNKKYKLVITNPPYGGDTIKTTELYDKILKIINELNIRESAETDEDQIEIYRKQKINLNKKLKEIKIRQDESKVTLESCGIDSRINKYAKKYGLKGNDKESCSLILLMDMVEEGGTVCGVLKEGVFFDGKYKDLRKHLVENFNVTAIISVDNKQFENTTTKTSIIVFHNTGKTENVEFYDLNMDVYENDKFNIDSENNLCLVENKGDVKGVYKEFVASATIDEILENEKFSLSGKEYDTIITTPNDGYKIVKLGDISEFMPKSKRPASFGKDNGKFNFYTSSEKIQKCDVCDYKDESIIIGGGGNSSIHVDSNYSCSSDSLILKTKYNMYTYHSIKTIWDILQYKMQGSTIKHVTKDLLKNLEIPIPESDEKIQEWTEKISKPYNDYIDKINEYEQLENQIQIDIQKMIDTNPCDKVKLGDICEIKSGKRVPKECNFSNSITNHPYIRITDIQKNGQIDINNIKYIDENVYLKIKNYIVNTNDICMSTVGNVGVIFKIPFKLNNANLTENCVKLLFNKLEEYKTYIFFYLQLSKFKTMLKSKINGTVQDKISLIDLRNIEIDIPKDKSLINNLQPSFDKIELLQKESTEAKELYENLLVELKKDAIKEIRNTKGIIYPEQLQQIHISENTNTIDIVDSIVSDNETTTQDTIQDTNDTSLEEEKLTKLSVPDLKKLCKDKGLKKYSKLKKSELIELLQK